MGVDDSGVPLVAGDADEAARVPYQRGVAEQADARAVAPRGVPAEERTTRGPRSSWRSSAGSSTGRVRRVGLRTDVTGADVLLVIATAAPALPDAVQQAAASAASTSCSRGFAPGRTFHGRRSPWSGRTSEHDTNV
ncbi:hypothetical protein STANM309S_00318 [Streptomyces tanashiensis]